MQYGHFDDEHREYVIERPDTPLPWINYLGTQEFFSLISNTAGGYCFYRDAQLRRLLRYRYNGVPQDVGARFLYLRDDEKGTFWSPTWQPTRTPLDQYTCRHGLGYSEIRSSSQGIEAQARFFVPLDETMEIWQLELVNRRATPARLSLFSAVEFCLWDARDDAANFQRNLSTGEVEVEGSVIIHKTEYRERRDHFAYFASSEPPVGFETQREAFLGPYRGWDSPQAVQCGRMQDTIAHGWAPIAAHHLQFSLAPGERKAVIFLLGYHENPREAKFDPPDSQVVNKRGLRPLLRRYLDPRQVDEAFARLHAYWDDLLSVLQVDTPDLHARRMVNVWNAYQCMVTFNLSRSASYFESGVGRGIGFRDSNQDLLGFVHMVPRRARQRLLDLAATQMRSGGAFHQYQPLTKRGNNEIGGDFNDDPLWLVLGAAAYLKESGDWSLLDEAVEFENRPGSAAPFLEHLQRSLAYTRSRLGPHGLPLIGRADWNDCLNLNCYSDEPGISFQTATSKDGIVAESILIAALFILAAREMADILRARGDEARAEDYCSQAEAMQQAALDHGWDGRWFLRAYDDQGNAVGSHKCREGQIFIETQGLGTMAGIGLSDGKALQAMTAVEDRLATPHGILLQQPPYSRYYLNLGEISTYPPGYKENAGIFCHTNPWVMIAEAILGRGDRAFDYYLRINPSVREAISEVHRCEPYVYAQMIAGRDAVNHGEAKNSWLTGTAAWNYVAVTQWILGIRPELDGLRIAPVLPGSWKGYTATRRFRQTLYRITVERAGAGNAVSLEVNGEPLDGTLVPLPPQGTDEVQVRAVVC